MSAGSSSSAVRAGSVRVKPVSSASLGAGGRFKYRTRLAGWLGRLLIGPLASAPGAPRLGLAFESNEGFRAA